MCQGLVVQYISGQRIYCPKWGNETLHRASVVPRRLGKCEVQGPSVGNIPGWCKRWPWWCPGLSTRVWIFFSCSDLLERAHCCTYRVSRCTQSLYRNFKDVKFHVRSNSHSFPLSSYEDTTPSLPIWPAIYKYLLLLPIWPAIVSTIPFPLSLSSSSPPFPSYS